MTDQPGYGRPPGEDGPDDGPPRGQGGYGPPQGQGGYGPPQGQGGYGPPQGQGGYASPGGGYGPPQERYGPGGEEPQGYGYGQAYGPPQGQGGYAAAPGYGQPPQAAGSGDLAGLGKRFGARLLDTLILFVPFLVISFVLALGGTLGTGVGFDPAGFLLNVVFTVAVIGYFAWFESSSGQTLGKKALGIRTVGPGGGLPTTAQAAKRNAWYLLGLIPFLGGLAQLAVVIAIAVTISSDPRDQGVHDKFAEGTTVVNA